jgi:hypothetical protein
MRLLAPLARTFTVRRRVGLAYGTTMEGLANDYAIALDEEFGGPSTYSAPRTRAS